jgi:hypothetical protein
MIDAGFVNVQEKLYKWPINAWPKDMKYKEIGEFLFFFFFSAWLLLLGRKEVLISGARHLDGAKHLQRAVRAERGAVYPRAGLDCTGDRGVFGECEEGPEGSAHPCLLAYVSYSPIRFGLLPWWVGHDG